MLDRTGSPCSRWPAGPYVAVQIVALLYYREGASAGKDDFKMHGSQFIKSFPENNGAPSIFSFEEPILFIYSASPASFFLDSTALNRNGFNLHTAGGVSRKLQKMVQASTAKNTRAAPNVS